MTSYPGQQPPAPKKTLTWLAIACFVIGTVLGGFFVWQIVKNVPSSPQPIGNGAVHLEKEGLTVYASQPVLSPPCEAKDASGADVPLKPPSGSESITINDETWYAVSRSARLVPPGDYVVSCTDDETNATYAVGPNMSVAGMVGSIFGAVLSFLVFFILGAVLLGVGAVKRRRANRPGNTFPTNPGGGPGYPPPGNTFPGTPNHPTTPGYPQQGYPQQGPGTPPSNT